MKRGAALVLASMAIALLATPAVADEQIPTGSPWGGSTVTRPDPVTAPVIEIPVSGRIQNNAGSPSSVTYAPPTVTITFSNDPDDGCDVAPDGPATEAELGAPTFDRTVAPTWKRHAYSASVPFSPTRNADYPLYVCINGVPRLDTVAQVRLPAPEVTNLVATAAGHEVDLGWDDMRLVAPDVSGYRVERSLGGGAFESLASVGPESPTFTDTTLPAAGGDASYRVRAIRPHVADGAASNTAGATFEPAPTDSTGQSGTGAGAGSGTGSGSGAGTGSGSGGSGGTRRPAASSGSAIRVPRVGTPSRNFFPALLAPPEDAGFSEDLPYDVGGDGDELAGDELSSDPIEALPGRGLAIPIATGLVLAVWALHLRFLARAARPEYDERVGVDILG